MQAPGFTHATQPHLLGIAGLSATQNTLGIMMKREETSDSGAVALEFELREQ